MRVITLKKQTSTLLAILLALVLVLVLTGQVFADSKPYFVTQGSDIFVGGQFNPAANCSTYYQEPNYPTPSSPGWYKGAILGYSNATTRVGARSDLGAFSIGLTEGGTPGTNDYGFFSGLPGQGTQPGINGLSFSNNNKFGLAKPPYWGGLFEGTSLKSNCIPDYYGTKQNTSPAPASWTGSFNSTGQFTYSGGTITGGVGQIINADTRLTIFVSGDVYINSNISYGSHTASTSPKFALVVKGNIFIDPNVTQLDGWYIAQPSSGTTDGVIWTCVRPGTLGAPNPPSTPEDTWMRQNCASPLTVNGALTAKQVNLGRIDASGNPLPGGSSETVNYIPEMAIGGGFFNQPPSTTAPIQSLISLPPIF